MASNGRLVGAKPLPEPVLVHCQLDSPEQVSVKFESEFYHFEPPEADSDINFKWTLELSLQTTFPMEKLRVLESCICSGLLSNMISRFHIDICKFWWYM